MQEIRQLNLFAKAEALVVSYGLCVYEVLATLGRAYDNRKAFLRLLDPTKDSLDLELHLNLKLTLNGYPVDREEGKLVHILHVPVQLLVEAPAPLDGVAWHLVDVGEPLQLCRLRVVVHRVPLYVLHVLEYILEVKLDIQSLLDGFALNALKLDHLQDKRQSLQALDSIFPNDDVLHQHAVDALDVSFALRVVDFDPHHDLLVGVE